MPFEDGLTTPDIMGMHKMDIGGWYKITIKKNGHITLDETIDGLPESSYWGSDSSPLRRRLSLLRFFIKDCNNISINISVVEEAKNFQKLRDLSRLLVRVSPMK
ncbi:hypothetical protein LGV61_04975 [Desulfurispirillum indicum]|uniref:hypothetical protein n=1 Tax=Desulfurispirillum indicum TaxID=936456 RepID=UPI001CF99DA2|nr:hypothetical protein [Desulfurispirillum indicum]UCZ57635.1 hypothetical protein LGV61_04975 [Desulfurispirillum indicum]